MRVLATFALVATITAAYAADAWAPTFQEDPAAFVSAGENPYFVLQPGFVLDYRAADKALRITVLDQVKKVDKVECRVVEEREWEGGELVEVSRNYFALGRDSKTLFYFGEDVDIYETGKITRHSGSWLSGKKGAKYGVLIPGRPELGQRYWQEQAPKVALDRAEVSRLNAVLETPAGRFEHCLETVETSPLEPGHTSVKVYAPGIGLIKDGELLLASYGSAKAPAR